MKPLFLSFLVALTIQAAHAADEPVILHGVNAEKPILIELVYSRRLGFKKRNRPWYRQPLGPKEYTYRTASGTNYVDLVDRSKLLPDRRPSEQRHPLTSAGGKVTNVAAGAFNLYGGLSH